MAHQMLERKTEWPALRINLAHVAALAGNRDQLTAAREAAVDFDERPWLNVVNGLPVQGWTALHIAAGQNHCEIMTALLDAGHAIAPLANDRTPLDIAIGRGHLLAVRLLLARGAKPGPRAVVCLGPESSEELIALLLAAGMDLNDSPPGYPLSFTVATDCHFSGPKRADYLRRLMGHGYRVDAGQLFGILDSVDEDSAAADGVFFIEAALEVATPDLNSEFERREDGAQKSLFELAMEKLSLSAVQQLTAAGAHTKFVDVKKSWPEAEAKRAWLKKMAILPPPQTLSDFMRLNDDLLTPSRIAKTVATSGLAIAGVAYDTGSTAVTQLGISCDETGFVAESEWNDFEERAAHSLQVDCEGQKVCGATYQVLFGDSERCDATFDAIVIAYRKNAGEPTGRKKLCWTDGVADLTCRKIARSDSRCGDMFGVELVLAQAEEKPASLAAPVSLKPKVVAKYIKDSLNGLVPDCFDVGIKIASVEVKLGETAQVTIDFELTPYDSDEAVGERVELEWAESEPVVGEYGVLAPGFTKEVLEALSNCIHR